jgi:hypothetical protein
VAEALAWPFTIKTIRYGALARLPNWLLGGTRLGLSAAARPALAPPWPELAWLTLPGRSSARTQVAGGQPIDPPSQITPM